jgi:hypothetical protein
MIVRGKIGESVAAAFAAAILTVTAVAAATGPVRSEMPRHAAEAPAALVAAPLSSQA